MLIPQETGCFVKFAPTCDASFLQSTFSHAKGRFSSSRFPRDEWKCALCRPVPERAIGIRSESSAPSQAVSGDIVAKALGTSLFFSIHLAPNPATFFIQVLFIRECFTRTENSFHFITRYFLRHLRKDVISHCLVLF